MGNAQAEIYLAPHGQGFAASSFAYGCTFSNKRSYALGRYDPECLGSPQGGGCGGVEDITLAGPIGAYEESSESPGEGASYTVVVRDLRTGRVLHKVAAGPPGRGPTTGIVVKSDGAVAWIVESRAVSNPPAEYQVHVLDKTGNRVLASGSEVEPHSLALAGSTLYWTQGGKPMSAVLN